MSRPAHIEIDHAALRHNVTLCREICSSARIMAVVKANAYGHGSCAVANTLSPLVDAFAVASIDEALQLRAAGIDAPIMLLEGLFDRDELAEALRQQFWIGITNTEQLDWMESAGAEHPATCWLKVNTGMNRLGVSPEQAQSCYTRLTNCEAVASPVTLFTHLAAADNSSSDYTDKQLQSFDRVEVDAPRSAANSAGVLAWPAAHYDWVRPGYMLYGNSPLPNDDESDLRPVMSLRSKVIDIRDVKPNSAVGYGGTFVARRRTTIATVAIGYGDGYPRNARNGTPVLVNGQRGKLAGRVSMDMITVDVTDIDGVQRGSDAVLWGPELTVGEVSAHCNTVGYELTTRLTGRLTRVDRNT